MPFRLTSGKPIDCNGPKVPSTSEHSSTSLAPTGPDRSISPLMRSSSPLAGSVSAQALSLSAKQALSQSGSVSAANGLEQRRLSSPLRQPYHGQSQVHNIISAPQLTRTSSQIIQRLTSQATHPGASGEDGLTRTAPMLLQTAGSHHAPQRRPSPRGHSLVTPVAGQAQSVMASAAPQVHSLSTARSTPALHPQLGGSIAARAEHSNGSAVPYGLLVQPPQRGPLHSPQRGVREARKPMNEKVLDRLGVLVQRMEETLSVLNRGAN